MTQHPVLLVEDTPSLSVVYEDQLRSAGIGCDMAETGAQALEFLNQRSYKAILLDLKLPDMDGFDILRNLNDMGVDSAVIVITAHGSMNMAVEAMQLGAKDFLVKPFAKERLITTVKNAIETATLQSEVTSIKEDLGRPSFQGFVGSSLPMQAIYKTIASVATSKASVFITGESGTGKEVCAEAIHNASPRRTEPFVPLNCGAIPSELIESEIFGHLKGSFTGATADRPGAALMANKGTLFLDEICEMDINLQSKLLRFLQTGKVQKVGSSKLEDVDVRIVCATNRDPLVEVEAGRFREDLYYRLHVVPIHLPPLRERAGDVLEIAEDFLKRFSREEGKAFTAYTPEAQDKLVTYGWPGNVRELQNVIRNAVVLNEGEQLDASMMTFSERSGQPAPTPITATPTMTAPAPSVAAATPAQPAQSGPNSVSLGRSYKEIEQDVIEKTISMCGGSIPKAAKLLQLSPSTIYRKREGWIEVTAGS
ncbi:MAG: sigma-54-dependent Fis family transcriptional regulator [Alphaproteobacteria bacterium]|nr:sigma-54-dependent Fis family transcriptional regulator [Alphaproteobacteria bacterium SS10]